MSTLHVENLKGLTSGGNANKIIVPSGQTLDASNGSVNASGGLTTPAGHVIQVLSTTTDNSFGITSTSLVDTGLSLTITPASTSSKILLFANMYEVFKQSATTSPMFSISRGGSVIGDHQGATLGYTYGNEYMNIQLQYTDSPSTTSATVYKIRFKSSNGNLVYINGDNTQSHLTLMEIAG